MNEQGTDSMDGTISIESPSLGANPSAGDNHPALSAGSALGAVAMLEACSSSGADSALNANAGLLDKEHIATAPPGSITSAQAARFILHAQFSVSLAEIGAVKNLGYGEWLHDQMMLPAGPTAWSWLMDQGYHRYDEDGKQIYPDTNPLTEPVAADRFMWHELMATPELETSPLPPTTSQIRKRIALALSEIFVCSSSGVKLRARPFAMAAYWDILTQSLDDDFRGLIEKLVLNPAMGAYLNVLGNLKADTSTGRIPDENFARELLQLFTIGLYKLKPNGTLDLDSAGKPVETYSQEDIMELARVFTGYKLNYNETTTTTGYTYPGTFDPAPEFVRRPMFVHAKNRSDDNHDYGRVKFLGLIIGKDRPAHLQLKKALDHICNHDNVAPFFCKQLIQRLVTSNPSPSYVQRVVNVFNANKQGKRGRIRSVVQAVLMDQEALSDGGLSSATFGKIREPMVRVAQWARTFQIKSVPVAHTNPLVPERNWKVVDLSSATNGIGQSPLRSPTVFNFFRPGYKLPNSTYTMLAPEMQMVNESSVTGYLNKMFTFIHGGFGSNQGGIRFPNYQPYIEQFTTIEQFVDHLSLVLTAHQLSEATKFKIIQACSSAATLNDRQRCAAAIFLVMASPEYLVQK